MAVEIKSLFITLVFALPLLYLPDLPRRDHLLRFIIFTVIVGLAAVILAVRLRANVAALTGRVQILLGLLGAALLFTWLYTLQSPYPVHYAGVDPDYLGYTAWAAFIVAGLVFLSEIKQFILSKKALVIAVSALGVSLVYGVYNFAYGLRLGGVLYQPLAMAMYANVVVLLCLYQLRGAKHKPKVKAALLLCLALAIFTVMACQTLVGTIVLIVSITLWSFFGLKSNARMRAGLLILLPMIVILPVLLPNNLTALRGESLQRGLTYKVELYKKYVPDMITHRFFYGNGPSSLPATINNQNYVPDDVAKNLGVHTRALANHDLLFDVGYYFGGLAAIALILINILAIRAYYKNRAHYNLAYLLIFLVLMTNAICNVPSLELTGLYFIVLFGLLAKSLAEVHKTKVSTAL